MSDLITKDQREECYKLAKKLMDSIYKLEPYKEPPDFDYCFTEGFESGVFSERQRAEVLVKTLNEVKTWGYSTMFQFIDLALAEYQKGLSDE